MTYFDLDELQLIVKRGEGKYDFSPKERFYQITIIKRINILSINNIENFLNYHFSDNQFQYLFAAIIYFYSKGDKWIIDKETKKIISNWLEDVFPLKIQTIDSLFEIIFIENKRDKNTRIKELIANVDLYKKVEVLSFSTKISEEGMMMHRKKYKITY